MGAAKLELTSFESARVAEWKDIQPCLKGVTLVSFMMELGKDNNTVILASEDGVIGIRIPDVDGREVRDLIVAFRKDLGISVEGTRDLNVEKAQPKAGSKAPASSAAARKLYSLLLKPVLPYLNTELVYISPDNVLNYLPFEALQDEKGRYFIEDHAVAYTPSANILKVCMDKERHRKGSILALGNPNLKNPAFRLVHAEEEVRALQSLFSKADVLTFDEATEDALKAHAADCDILHLACHGELNHDDPMLSSLRLAPDTKDDGYLHAGEVFEMNLSASLVVLSACNSGLGELSMGNELMGLTRGIFAAGVPSVVASLWTVDDRSTAFLMERFYTNLQTMNKAEALRQAKLATMKQYPSPFHWAPFCLQGDYR